ncbi:MAG: Superfamily II RNA helicase [Acidobacteria bacterium OLB17]|nr:MAG: Superfamily II RNA helicase [Acidobacteria bacterium OLB17]MCZ2390078.1 hypothetical protein [Acidobacteriota bacterium]
MNDNDREIRPPKLIAVLRRHDLLPAIVFLPTRRHCDEAATEVSLDRSQPADPERQRARSEMFEAFAAENPEILSHKHVKALLQSGTASHHAGHIPAWKLIVEKMMSAGLLRAIFATSTVAAGVDFPARTVVISNTDTRGNDGWRPLRVSELQQMTGRAGRRGRDNVGFVILAPGRFQNPRKIAELLRSRPEALESRFRATYTSLLNLLDAFSSFDRVREITEKSFAFRGIARRKDDPEKLAERIWQPFEDRANVLGHFGYLDIESETVTEDGKWLANLRVDRPLLIGEALRDGVFDELAIPEFAGMIAAVAADAERTYGELRVSRRLDTAFDRLEAVVARVSNIEWKYGVEVNEELNFSAAAAAERWAAGMEWSELTARSKAAEGDLVRLLSRTGEALRQVGGLGLPASKLASEASTRLLREPVR